MAVSGFTRSLIDGGFKTDDTLKAAAQCTKEYRALNEKIKQMEDALADAKKDAELLGGFVVPTLLANAGVKSFTLDDGGKVSVTEQVFCSLPKTDAAARERCLNWLNENGGGGIIKDQLVVNSPDEALINEVKGKYVIERKRDVNTNSLKAFMAEALGIKQNSVARMTDDDVPTELNLFVKHTTKVQE